MYTTNGKRQMLKKLENEQIKTNQKIFVDKKLRETTNLCVEIMNSRRHAKGKLSHVAQIQFTFAVDVNVMINLSIVV